MRLDFWRDSCPSRVGLRGHGPNLGEGIDAEAERKRGGSRNVTCNHMPELMRGRSRRGGRLKLGTPKALDILGWGLGW